MKLTEWLSIEKGRAAALAKGIGAHAPDVSRWALPPTDKNYRPIPFRFGPKIEAFTGGEVTRQEMFDDWASLWPELSKAA